MDSSNVVPVTDASGYQMAYAGNGHLRSGFKLPNLQATLDNGVRGHVHRIGNGSSLDESFAPVANEAWAVGLPLGSYYYIQPYTLTPPQAYDWIMRHLAPYPFVEHVHLDCEKVNGAPLFPTGADQAFMSGWIAELAHRLDVGWRKPLIYSGQSWWNPNVGASYNDFTGYDVIAPRYAYQSTKVPQDKWRQPPADATQWSNWVAWKDQPRASYPNLAPYEAWQFTSWLQAQAFGWPSDGGTRLDGNMYGADMFARAFPSTVAPSPPPVVEPPVVVTPPPAPQPSNEVDMSQFEHRIYDSRNDPRGPFKKGEGRTIVVNPEAISATINVQAIRVTGSGAFYLTNDGTLPETPDAGFEGTSGFANNLAVTDLNGDGAVDVFLDGQLGVQAHVILDVKRITVR